MLTPTCATTSDEASVRSLNHHQRLAKSEAPSDARTMINELRSRKAYKDLAQGFNHISAKIKCPRRAREAHNGRAKTSAHLVAAPFRSASPCAGFEPCPSIDLVMKTFEFRASRLAVVERIFIVGLAAVKTEGWMFWKCGRAPMAQTRRRGMQNDFAQLPNAPRFSPYHYEVSRAHCGSPMPYLSAYGF